MAAKKPAPSPIDEAWFSRLDDAWKKVFADQCGVDSAKKLKKLVSVKDLYIDDDAQVTSLAPIEKLQKIEEINCDAKKVTDLSPLAKLPKLKSLRISSPISDFSPIAKMTALESLELADTQISNVSPIALLAKLERLDLSGTPVSDLRPLAALKKIERLEIHRTKVRDLAPIAGWKKLRDLDISYTPVEDFSPLAKMSLSSLGLSGTSIPSLEPIWSQTGIHILQIRETKLGFEKVLRYMAHRTEEEQDSMLGLDVYSDWNDREAFLKAIEAIDFPLAGVEAIVTAWINNTIIALVKDEEDAPKAPAVLALFRKLGVGPNKYTKEIAGNALHVIVTQNVEPDLEKWVMEELVPAAEMDRRLAYNLACYHARRGNKREALRHARIALEKGQEAEKFRSDPDFESLRGDPELQAIVSASYTPDPKSAPLEWWKSLPEEIRNGFSLYEDETDANVRAMLDDEDVRFDAHGVRSLDALRGLRIKHIRLMECKASSLEIIGTIEGLEDLDWEKNEYLGGTKLADLGPIAACTSLRRLVMPGHAFSDLSPLAGLVELRTLQLRGSPITSIAPLAKLRKLENLSIDPAAPLDLSVFENLEALQDLWLQGPVVSLEPLRHLKSLRRVWMQRLTLADGSTPSLEPLFGLKNLANVWVKDAKSVKKELKKVLPKCEVA